MADAFVPIHRTIHQVKHFQTKSIMAAKEKKKFKKKREKEKSVQRVKLNYITITSLLPFLKKIMETR